MKKLLIVSVAAMALLAACQDKEPAKATLQIVWKQKRKVLLQKIQRKIKHR